MEACSPFCKVTFVPIGIMAASTSRFRVTDSLLFIAKTQYSRPRSACRVNPKLNLLGLSGHGLAVALERRHDRVPRQDGTLHSSGKVVDAREDRQFYDITLE